MIELTPLQAAHAAVAANPTKPAMAIIHDAPDVRLVVFRLEPGQQVTPHTSPSTVLLEVLEGTGMISWADGERSAGPGGMVTFVPGELHGMRALDERFCLLATIAPRPGGR